MLALKIINFFNIIITLKISSIFLIPVKSSKITLVVLPDRWIVETLRCSLRFFFNTDLIFCGLLSLAALNWKPPVLFFAFYGKFCLLDFQWVLSHVIHNYLSHNVRSAFLPVPVNLVFCLIASCWLGISGIEVLSPFVKRMCRAFVIMSYSKGASWCFRILILSSIACQIWEETNNYSSVWDIVQSLCIVQRLCIVQVHWHVSPIDRY